MESLAVTPDKFETEVLKSDKPVVVISIPIDYGNQSDPSDDSIQMYGIRLEEFKSEVQKTVGDRYKIALIDRNSEAELVGRYIPTPLIYPPPLPFLVYEKGEQSKVGFLLGYSKEAMFESLKNQLST